MRVRQSKRSLVAGAPLTGTWLFFILYAHDPSGTAPSYPRQDPTAPLPPARRVLASEGFDLGQPWIVLFPPLVPSPRGQGDGGFVLGRSRTEFEQAADLAPGRRCFFGWRLPRRFGGRSVVR